VSGEGREENPGGAEGRLAGFRAYLRERLAATGVAGEALSLAMGKDRGYVGQLLDPGRGRHRALPDPDELRAAAEVLQVPLLELLDRAYGITRAELEAELGTAAAHRGAWAEELAALTRTQQEQVLTFLAYVKAHGAARGGA